MHRLDYQWKRLLKKEQEEASATKLVNKMLLQNILPTHVGNNWEMIEFGIIQSSKLPLINPTHFLF